MGVLTFGVVSEQVKTRLEVRDEGQSEVRDGAPTVPRAVLLLGPVQLLLHGGCEPPLLTRDSLAGSRWRRGPH